MNFNDIKRKWLLINLLNQADILDTCYKINECIDNYICIIITDEGYLVFDYIKWEKQNGCYFKTLDEVISNMKERYLDKNKKTKIR